MNFIDARGIGDDSCDNLRKLFAQDFEGCDDVFSTTSYCSGS